MCLKDDGTSNTWFLPLLMSFITIIYAHTPFAYKKSFELCNRDVAKSDSVHA